ncbi:hypothetical protein [Gallaecimonas xiamenensis]|uniref:hypothetical protein n=1 Tax=Gallaecimonas xiamenensis TaxID=1207039 RepID=UPI0012EA93CC|nr:hypothetical protein [Gallaecimonas xiamenensis]
MKAAIITLLLAQVSFSAPAAQSDHYTVYLNSTPLVQSLYASVQESFDALSVQREVDCQRLNEDWLDQLALQSSLKKVENSDAETG